MEAALFLNDIPTELAARAFHGMSFSPEKRGILPKLNSAIIAFPTGNDGCCRTKTEGIYMQKERIASVVAALATLLVLWPMIDLIAALVASVLVALSVQQLYLWKLTKSQPLFHLVSLIFSALAIALLSMRDPFAHVAGLLAVLVHFSRIYVLRVFDEAYEESKKDEIK